VEFKDFNRFKVSMDELFKAFLYSYWGKQPSNPTEQAEFRHLYKKGLIKKYRVDTLTLLFQLGRAAKTYSPEIVKQWPKSRLEKFITSEGKLTPQESLAIAFIKSEAENTLQNLFGTVVSTIELDYKTKIIGSEAFKVGVKDAVIERIAKRQSLQQLSVNIGKNTANWSRNLYRIAFVESANAYNFGIVLNELRMTNQEADEVWVAKIPKPDACPHCKRLCWDSKTNSPILYRLSDVLGNSNIHKKVKEWSFCISSIHPYCRCLLSIVNPKLQEFNPKMRRFEFKKDLLKKKEV
jgi:hypothetical protein